MAILKEQLYDALGELIYALAISDGIVQAEETQKLEELLKQHPWSAAIQWSFNYEKLKGKSLEDAYQKAISICKDYGPSEEYAFLMEAMEAVAQASDGIDAQESHLINRFKEELTEHFKNTL